MSDVIIPIPVPTPVVPPAPTPEPVVPHVGGIDKETILKIEQVLASILTIGERLAPDSIKKYLIVIETLLVKYGQADWFINLIVLLSELFDRKKASGEELTKQELATVVVAALLK